MLINIKVRPCKNTNKIEIKKNYFIASLTEKPEKGKANKALIKLLSDFFNIPKQNINILKGLTKRHKLIEIIKTSNTKMKNPICTQQNLNIISKEKNYLKKMHCWER